MKKIIILISIMFFAGCVSKFNVEKANTYVMSHPDRPDHIKKAISVGEVVQGMNEEEVTICMGKPDTITTTQSYPLNTITTGWFYFNNSQLKRTFIFFKDGAVVGINISTQKGMIVMPFPGGPINSGPIIRPYPGGVFNSDPIISPSNQNIIYNHKPIITTPPVNKNCPKK
jgi:hypothetical protein